MIQGSVVTSTLSADEQGSLALAALDRDDVWAALGHARAAVATARRAADPGAEGRARLALVRALVFAGRVSQAHREIDRAANLLGPEDRGRLELQRMAAHYKTGDHHAAMVALAAALDALPDDSLDVARALNNRGITQMYLGGFEDGLADLREARRRYLAAGRAFAAAETLTNIGMMLDRLGQLPEALHTLGEAESERLAIGAPIERDRVARAEVQLRAGLYDEVLLALPSAVAALEASGMVADAAEGALYLAQAQLRSGDVQAAESARRARVALTRARRWGWAALAHHAQTQAAVAGGATGRRALRDAQAATDALLRAGLALEARESWVLAGRIAAASGEVAEAERCWHLAAAPVPAVARRRSSHTEVVRAEAQARLALVRGRRGVAMAHCGRGLDRVEAELGALVAADLRAAAAQRGMGLARLGLEIAWASREPAQILRWAERWRAVALHSSPGVVPSRQLARLLVRLRAAAAASRQAVLDGADEVTVVASEQRCAELEAAVQAASRGRSAGEGSKRDGPVAGRPRPRNRPTTAQLREALEGRALVELVERDGQLGAVVVTRRRTRLVTIGALAPVTDAAKALHFALRRLAVLQASVASTARASAERMFARMDELVIAPLRGALGGADEVVVVPDRSLHELPWPALFGPATAATVAPSAALWWATLAARPEPRGHVALIAGPRLPAAAREVAEIAAVYPAGATLLTGAAATARSVARAVEGASVAHLAAHGLVRRDNPLFSSLELHDGPITVLDLEHLRQPPAVIVLAACNSAVGSVAASNDVVGLAAAMLSGGARSVIASVLPLPDEASAPMMVQLHRAMQGGLSPARALAELRSRPALDTPAGYLAAQALVCLGAG